MSQKSDNSIQNTSEQNPELKRKLGLVPVIALGVGSTVGAGIFTTLSQVADQAGSSLWLVLAFTIGALFQIPSALCYAELSSAYPEDGGQYVYFREAGSKCLAFLSGWISLIATDPPSVSIMALALVNYLMVFLPFDLITLRFIAVCIVILLALVHLRSVSGGGYFQTFITIIKIIPFAIIICVGFFFINPDLFMSPNLMIEYSYENITPMAAIGALFAAVSLASFSFDGLYSACYVSGEIKNPKRNLPIGLVVTALIVLVLYVSLTMVASGLLTIDELSASSAPISLLASKIPVIGDVASVMVAVIACIVIIGTISSCILYQPRIEYAMARDGYFFKIFGLVHKKYETPYVSILFHVVITISLTFVGQLSAILEYFTLVVLLKNLGAYATMFVLRKKPGYNPSYRCPGGNLMPILSIAFICACLVATIVNLDIIGVCFSVLAVVSGLPAFFFWDRKNKKAELSSQKNR